MDFEVSPRGYMENSICRERKVAAHEHTKGACIEMGSDVFLHWLDPILLPNQICLGYDFDSPVPNRFEDEDMEVAFAASWLEPVTAANRAYIYAAIIAPVIDARRRSTQCF